MLLAAFGIFLSIASLIKVSMHYNFMIGSSDWKSFTDYQKYHLIFHALAILLYASFLSGFALYTVNDRIWIFMSAVSESLIYLIQVLVSVFVIR